MKRSLTDEEIALINRFRPRSEMVDRCRPRVTVSGRIMPAGQGARFPGPSRAVSARLQARRRGMRPHVAGDCT
jgi:hypothetical protein